MPAIARVARELNFSTTRLSFYTTPLNQSRLNPVADRRNIWVEPPGVVASDRGSNTGYRSLTPRWSASPIGVWPALSSFKTQTVPMTKYLEHAANTAVIVLCLLLGASIVRSFLARTPRSSAPAEAAPAGYTLPGIERPDIGSKATVLVILSRTCEFCERSLPFYRQLLQLPQMDGKTTRLVVLAMDDVSRMDAYLKEHNVRPHAVLSLPRSEPLPVKGVPALFVLDATGKIRKSWIGLLEAAVEQEVVSFLGGTD